uniref:Putative secreted peptide n=1 Tax=Anopheles braziliensis TaxID=58242 RepID=A0A2M3ZX74_9DIPT
MGMKKLLKCTIAQYLAAIAAAVAANSLLFVFRSFGPFVGSVSGFILIIERALKIKACEKTFTVIGPRKDI